MATAFHRNTMTNDEGGTDDEEFRVAAVKDRVDTTVQVWMGLTMGCAKCHSHKYDPITQKEYYRFFAFFNQTADTDRPTTLPPSRSRRPTQQARVDALRAQVERRRARLAGPTDAARNLSDGAEQTARMATRGSITAPPPPRPGPRARRSPGSTKEIDASRGLGPDADHARAARDERA